MALKSPIPEAYTRVISLGPPVVKKRRSSSMAISSAKPAIPIPSVAIVSPSLMIRTASSADRLFPLCCLSAPITGNIGWVNSFSGVVSCMGNPLFFMPQINVSRSPLPDRLYSPSTARHLPLALSGNFKTSQWLTFATVNGISINPGYRIKENDCKHHERLYQRDHSDIRIGLLVSQSAHGQKGDHRSIMGQT